MNPNKDNVMIYNLMQFGTAFRTIRKSYGYSYKTLSEHSGIAMNTLRNIERGKVVPNIDTLSQLSDHLRTDLTSLFLNCKIDRYAQYDAFFHRFEKMVARHRSDLLPILIGDVEIALSDVYSMEDHLLQQKTLQLYYRMIGYSEHRIRGDKDMAMTFYLKAIHVSLPGFQLMDYEDFNYNYGELHILFNMAQLLPKGAVKPDHLPLYHFIYDHYAQLVEREIYMFPTLVNNIAVVYLNQGDYKQAMKFVNVGLSFINDEQTNIDMPALILCKGIILHYMGSEYSTFYIDLSFDLLVLSNRKDIIGIALKELKQRHGIDYELKIRPL